MGMTDELHYPADLRFTCTQCGDCCREANVQVNSAELEGLKRLDWKTHAPDLEAKDTPRPDRIAADPIDRNRLFIGFLRLKRDQ